VTGQKANNEFAEDSAYELEALWQLSEQGQYDFDYGLLIEAERENTRNISEISAALLVEKEFFHSSLAVNTGLAYEFGGGIDNEYDTFLKAQWRYRYQPQLEPAIEIHLDEYDKAMGPALMGLIRTGHRQKLKWGLAWLFGLNKITPASSIKLELEFEF
jgi:hypothetical protein